MKNLKYKMIILGLVGMLISLITVSNALAEIDAEVRANEEGLYVKCDLAPFGGSTEVSLAPGDPMTEIIAIKGIFTVEAAVQDITTAPNAVSISVKLSSPLLKQGAIEMPVTVPFGAFGMHTSFIERQFIPAANHGIEASVMLSKLKTQYDVNLNLGALFEGYWDGEATPLNNSITETVVNHQDNSILADINLVFKYASKFFTIINYNIALGPQESELSAAGVQGKSAKDLTGKILVPNGTYHIWADLDLSSYE